MSTATRWCRQCLDRRVPDAARSANEIARRTPSSRYVAARPSRFASNGLETSQEGVKGRQESHGVLTVHVVTALRNSDELAIGQVLGETLSAFGG